MLKKLILAVLLMVGAFSANAQFMDTVTRFETGVSSKVLGPTVGAVASTVESNSDKPNTTSNTSDNKQVTEVEPWIGVLYLLFIFLILPLGVVELWDYLTRSRN